MPRSFSHDKRAVSEIIASLILILIVTAAGVLVYSFSLGAFSSSTSFFQLDTNEKEEKTRERFSIIAVRNTATENQLNLTVLNYGKIEIIIDAAYVDGTNVTNLFGNGVITGTGALTSVQFVSPTPIQSGRTYKIATVSRRGTQNAVFWKAS